MALQAKASRRFSAAAALFSIIFACMVALGGCSASDAQPDPGTTQAQQSSWSDTSSLDGEDSSQDAEAAGVAAGSSSEESAGRSPHAEGTLKAHFIDVGQGDSEFLELPNGQTMLIDAGEYDEAQTVIGYVRSLGYDRIDYVVATHPHSDHIGAMAQVIRAFDVGQVWAPRVSHDTRTFEAFLDAVSSKGLGIETATRGKQVLSAQGCTVEVLSPAEGASYEDLNEWSVILKVTFGNQTMLFTGDAGTGVTSAAQPGSIDVLKVGHHGSYASTNAALVKSMAPTYAVIECGEGNSYGHPHKEALAALEGVTLYRTDVNGTVTATCDGTDAAGIFWETGITTPRSAVAGPPAPPASADTSSDAAGSDAAGSAAGVAAGDAESSSMTVYITDTGKKYHLDGCSGLSKSKHAISLADAKAQGYGACKRCNPPA